MRKNTKKESNPEKTHDLKKSSNSKRENRAGKEGQTKKTNDEKRIIELKRMNDAKHEYDIKEKNKNNNNVLGSQLEGISLAEMRQGIILSEILGKPVSKRRNRQRVGR